MKKLSILFFILAFVILLTQIFYDPIFVNLCSNNRWGYLDLKNNIRIHFLYSEARTFHEGLAVACLSELGNQCGAINKHGDTVIPFIYDDLSDFKDGLSVFRVGDEENGEYGVINKKGNIVIPKEKRILSQFSEGLAAVSNNEGKFGYINKRNELVISYKYSMAQDFQNGYAVVERFGKKGLINKKDELIIPCEYESIGEIKNKQIVLCKATSHKTIDSCGVEDFYGNQVIPFENMGVQFGENETYLINKVGGGYKYVDKNNNKIFEKEFEIAYPFEHGMAQVCAAHEKCGYINLKGEYMIAPVYQSLSPIFYGKIIAAQKFGGWGIIDTKGKVLIPFLYNWTGLVY